MLIKWLNSKPICIANLLAAVNFVVTPTYAEGVRPAGPVAVNYLPAATAADPWSRGIRLTRGAPETTFWGVKFRLSSSHDFANYRDEVSILAHCDQSKADLPAADAIANVTAGCGAFSVLTTGPVIIEIPYQADGIQRVIDESAVQVFRADDRLAALGAVQSLESYVDSENKRTAATLRQQTGEYFAGVLKTLERPDRPPRRFDGQSLSGLVQANPLIGVPLIAKPQPSPFGDARLTYPLDLPGTRNDFRPSIGIEYVSKSGYGPLGEGWHLSIPEISVETRWGVPIYDPDFETETYVFNGEQLVPEAGESLAAEAGDRLIGNPADDLHLVPLPHRTTYLRPRKKGDTRFVLRRDEGLWRFIRHGSSPSEYWWEAWQEKPGQGAPKISYFGHAPGRVPGAIENVQNLDGHPGPSTYALRLGPATINPHPRAISRWVLAREVDAHRNVIDYDWQEDCQPTCSGVDATNITSHDLLLRRILYTSNLATEEAVIRCREEHDLKGCADEWAIYEVLFGWNAADGAYRRSDARSGGLVVMGRLLDRIDVRGRQLKSPRLSDEPLKWSCSPPFLRFSFAYRGEFGPAGVAGPDVTERGTGRAFLKSITKRVASKTKTEIFGPRGSLLDTGCESSSESELTWEAAFPTQFTYDLSGMRSWPSGSTGQTGLEKASLFDLVDQARSRLFGADQRRGPIAPSMLGTTATSDASISFYAGLNLFNPGKENSFGVKVNSSRRTGYREGTVLLDLDGDGITDIIVREANGVYKVHRGQLDNNGQLSFAPGVPLSVPPGFTGFNREPFQSTDGFAVEAHLLGTFFASMSSHSSATQDTYVVDVNGDGRPDVVSNGVVYFNTSGNGAFSFSTAQPGAYIDPRSSAGLSSSVAAALLQEVRSGLPTSVESADAPRVDPVRVWRAPFSGDVFVRGAIAYAPPAKPSGYYEELNEQDISLKQQRTEDRRDGMLVTVELNHRPAWEAPGVVRRCLALKFDKQSAPQSIAIATPQPDSRLPVPVVPCFDATRAGWPSMPDLPAALGPDKGLLVSVDAGDILYVRAHSIDNAQDDVVRLAPAIDYIRLSEDSAGTGGVNPVVHSIVYGAGSATGDPGVDAVVASVGLASSVCGQLTTVDQTGTQTQINEATVNLCDRWGRSIVRYRGVEEKDPFVNGNGLLIAPFTGRMHFEGVLAKPATLFGGEIAIRILPPPQVPDAHGHIPSVDVGCAVDSREVNGTIFKSILTFGPDAGHYPSKPADNADNQIFVNRGERVCIFVRFTVGDEQQAILLPEDMSQFTWQNGGLRAVFDRKLLVVQLDRKDRNPDDFLSDLDRSLAQTALSECPAQSGAPTSVKVPAPGNDPNDPSTWTGTLYISLRCVKVPNEYHWVSPRSIGSVSSYFYPAGTPRIGVTPPGALRFARRLRKIKLPASTLVCPSDSTLREYRFRVDVGTNEQPSPIPIDQDTRRPVALGTNPSPSPSARPPIARKSVLLSLLQGELRTPLPARAFIVRAASALPALITDGYLVDMITGGAQKVDDRAPAKYLNFQIVRHLPPPPGGPPAPRPDARDAFYVEFNEGAPVNANDDGVRVYPSDRVGYSFCAPDQAEIEVTTIVDRIKPNDDTADQLLASGACGATCPINRSVAEFAHRSGLNPQGDPQEVPIFSLARLPIEPEFYRGWGYLSVTTEFVEALPVDDGSKLEDPRVPLSYVSAEIASVPEKLPTVRDFNRLRSRFLNRQGPNSTPTDAGSVLHGDAPNAGPCGPTAPRQCIREQFTSQIRVHALTGNYRAAVDQQPTDWIYCLDNGSKRDKSPNDLAAEAVTGPMPKRLQSRAGIDIPAPHYCSVGADVGLWVSEDYMSATRLGVKDLVDPVANSLAVQERSLSFPVADTSSSSLVRLLPKVSQTDNNGYAASAWVGASHSTTTTHSEADVFDLNGDGFPDQIVGDNVFLTDPSGRFRCLSGGVWANRFPCQPGASGPIDFGAAFTRHSTGDTSSLSIAFASPKTFAMGATSAAARIGAALSGQAQTSRDPAMTPLSIGAEFSHGTSLRDADLVDLNGDGLPDLVSNSTTKLNLGYAFSGNGGGWANSLMQEESAAVGLSMSLGYGNDIQEYGGGISASSTRSRQKRIMVDINGDGLIDVIRVDGTNIYVQFNTGFGFGQEQLIASLDRPLDAIGQGESDMLGANAYFTASIPIWLVVWTIYIILNPGASLGATVNRQVVVMRDADADGLPDLIVTGGLNVGGDINMMFDNQSATVYRNPLGTRGLMTGVFLPTNPDSMKALPDVGHANYAFNYARSAPSEDVPQSRWVLSEVIARDGVSIDDAFGIHDRRTCLSYENGFYDRFERRFLGFSHLISVAGCTTSFASRSQVQRGEGDTLKGIRRTDRIYANRSIYESGILLSETITDIASPAIVTGSRSPTRVVENTYVLLDVGTSTATRRECFALSVQAGPANAGSLPQMRPMLSASEGGRIEFPTLRQNGEETGPCHTLPAFDRDPRRLTPILVQSVRTSTEGDTARLVTAAQFAFDQRARVTRMCDLGQLLDANGAPYRVDDACGSYNYDDQIQLSFIHGATGGGVLAFDRRDRVRDIVIRSGPDEASKIERRRTASYDPATGDLVALCQFENVNLGSDLCSQLQGLPLKADELRAGSQQRVAVRRYHYDRFGNLDAYVSPASADEYFASRRLSFDPYLHLVELADLVDYCKIGGTAPASDNCPAGSASALGTFTARMLDVDWRHALATTQIDINHNAIHSVLDGSGRPTVVFATWAGTWAQQPNCDAGECSALPPDQLKPRARWGKLLSYAYRVAPAMDNATSVARITRFADASLYKRTGQSDQLTGMAAFDTDQHFDQLGRLIRTISPTDVCNPGPETADGAICDPDKRATHVATGLVTTDAAEREIDVFLPVGVNDLPPLASASVGPLPGEDLSGGPRAHVVPDGFDRPLHVRLTDGNSYAFKYELASIASNVVRHRTVTRDSRCVPSAMDRDERGLIRAVHEFMNVGSGTDFDAHVVGSSSNQGDKAIILHAGWVKDIDDRDSHQQVDTCVRGHASASNDPAAPWGVIGNPLVDPFTDNGPLRRRDSTLYDYDALGQLTMVALPNRVATVPSAPISASDKAIRVAYDAFGRRLATDDPDRGFEYISYDLVSNLVCHRSGPGAGNQTQFGKILDVFRGERMRTGAGPSARLAGEDMCLEPGTGLRKQVARVIQNDFLYDRLTKVIYQYPAPVDQARKNVTIDYGRADDVAANRAGREIKVTDVTGTISFDSFHPLGLVEKAERTILGLTRGAAALPSTPAGTLIHAEAYDTWGLMRRATLTGHFAGLRSDGTNDPNAARGIAVNEAIDYRYSTAGQINEVRVGTPCRALAGGTEDCRDVPPAITVIADAAYDERGNTLRLAFGNGVVTRNEFDPRSNRLLTSASRIGVPCVEYGPGDDCSTSSPPILFQNLSYSYDAAGLVTAYQNKPRYADLCTGLPPGQTCPPIARDHAGIMGLLVTGSDNRITYDERARIRTADKTVQAFGRDDLYQEMDDATFHTAKAAEVKVAEAFAFADSHLLTGIRRSINRRFIPGTSGGAETTTIRQTYGTARATAPQRVTVRKPDGVNEDQAYAQDNFGRLWTVQCAGCLVTPLPGEKQFQSRAYTWDPDDTLAVVLRRVEPTERQDTDANRQSRYFTQVDQVYDHDGNRTIKRWSTIVRRSNGVSERTLKNETIYADERLTVTRNLGQKPEALLHIFAGSTRLASKLTGREGLFTYHAQLPTRTVSDVVYAQADDRTTARIHQQIEYAAFGEMLLGREKTIAAENRDPGDRRPFKRPIYRFNAKELDEETDLTYFGARHYDQELGLWLSPDPMSERYLGGGPNGGVFAPKNLVAYGFGWGNPIGYRDDQGRVVNFVLGGIESAAIGSGLQFLEMGLGFRKEFSYGQLTADFALGFATSGLSSLAKAERIEQVAARAIEEAAKEPSRASRVQALLRDIATRSEKIYERAFRNEPLSPQEAGTKMHDIAARLLEKHQARYGEFTELEIETSFGGETAGGRFPRGSVRPDVHDPIDMINYDYKFSKGGDIPRGQHLLNMRNIPGSVDTVPIVPESWYNNIFRAE